MKAVLTERDHVCLLHPASTPEGHCSNNVNSAFRFLNAELSAKRSEVIFDPNHNLFLNPSANIRGGKLFVACPLEAVSKCESLSVGLRFKMSKVAAEIKQTALNL